MNDYLFQYFEEKYKILNISLSFRLLISNRKSKRKHRQNEQLNLRYNNIIIIIVTFTNVEHSTAYDRVRH